MDFRDNEINEFLDDGIRSDCIRERSFDTDFDRIMGESAPSSRPVINIDSWGKSEPVTSIFSGAPMPTPDVEPEYRPATAPEQKRANVVDRIPVIERAALNCKEKAL